MANAAANTGIMPTTLVALEQYFPKSQRVIDDSLAVRMLPFGASMFVRLLKRRWMRDWLIRLSEKSNPGIWGGLLCRRRYIDEKIIADRNEIEAVVSLGAGFDTRPFRLPPLSGLPMWEIDQRENITAKEERLRKALGAVPANLKLVTVDFDRDDLGAILESQGYSASKRTFFIWEAVFTYVRKRFLTAKDLYGWESGYKRFVATKVWLFGMEPEECPPFLQGYGWRVIEDIGYDELAARYIGPTGRPMASTPVERMV
jgi:methyltransferase (TIGR00027 family)